MIVISFLGIIVIEIVILYSIIFVLKLNLFIINIMNVSKNVNLSRLYVIRLSFFYIVVDCVLDLLIVFEILLILVDIFVDIIIVFFLFFIIVLCE